MTSDVYRKVGRGGAGNFIPEKDIAAAAKAQISQKVGGRSDHELATR
jgi:hypothetical protein